MNAVDSLEIISNSMLVPAGLWAFVQQGIEATNCMASVDDVSAKVTIYADVDHAPAEPAATTGHLVVFKTAGDAAKFDHWLDGARRSMR